MAVLKKVPASTLMETLVATVLIVLVFMASSMILNNLFANSVRGNQNEIRQELARLQYRYQNGILEVPFLEERGGWTIAVSKGSRSHTHILYTAVHGANKQKITIREWVQETR